MGRSNALYLVVTSTTSSRCTLTTAQIRSTSASRRASRRGGTWRTRGRSPICSTSTYRPPTAVTLSRRKTTSRTWSTLTYQTGCRSPFTRPKRPRPTISPPLSKTPCVPNPSVPSIIIYAPADLPIARRCPTLLLDADAPRRCVRRRPPLSGDELSHGTAALRCSARPHVLAPPQVRRPELPALRDERPHRLL
eukprot:4786802-Pleurochrysis_carterae.AAC.1